MYWVRRCATRTGQSAGTKRSRDPLSPARGGGDGLGLVLSVLEGSATEKQLHEGDPGDGDTVEQLFDAPSGNFDDHTGGSEAGNEEGVLAVSPIALEMTSSGCAAAACMEMSLALPLRLHVVELLQAAEYSPAQKASP